VEDCKSAVRFLRQHAAKLGIDPARIAAGGGSAGGHTAAATGIVPGLDAKDEDLSISSKPNLLVLYNPVLNTTGLTERMPADIAKRISPNSYLTKDTPPAIILFGTNDKLLATAEEYLQIGQKFGIVAELYTADGAAHGFFNRPPWNDRTLFLVDQFLAKHGYLKGKPTAKPEGGPQMKLVGVR
jgi:acetyl esterase/lipase